MQGFSVCLLVLHNGTSLCNCAFLVEITVKKRMQLQEPNFSPVLFYISRQYFFFIFFEEFVYFFCTINYRVYVFLDYLQPF